MKKALNSLVEELKNNNEDFELYPSTEEMIRTVYDSIQKHYGVSSILDIGCGTCNFLKFWKKFESGNDYQRIPNYFVMEKSQILLNQLPKEAIVLGTDFEKNSLIDKPVDAIFCNPPYSQYVEWTVRIIRESIAKHLYLIIPQRWAENDEIRAALNDTKSVATALDSFNFLDAERQARAKVDVVYINKERTPNDDAFDKWFDATFPMEDRKVMHEYDREQNEKNSLKNKISCAENKIEMLLSFYEEELGNLQKHFKLITEMDADVLEAINIQKTAVKEALKNKIKGLKTKYWREVFDNLSEITSRLTSNSREKMFKRYSDIFTVDFNYENIYALLIWVCKNASAYYNEQLIDWYKEMTSPDNIIKYKSNQKFFKRNEWNPKRFDDQKSISHYCLAHRIISDNNLFRSKYSWSNELDEYNTHRVVDDMCVLANNLGFFVLRREYASVYGQKYYIYGQDEKPILEYKVYQNGNTHIKMNVEFCKALNVEVSRLLGWIQTKEDIAKEFPDEMAKGAEKYFGRNLSITGSTLKLLK